MENTINDRLNEIQKILNNRVANKWMTIKEVSEYSALSFSTIYRASLKGALKVSQKTGKNLFKKEWVDEFLGL